MGEASRMFRVETWGRRWAFQAEWTPSAGQWNSSLENWRSFGVSSKVAHKNPGQREEARSWRACWDMHGGLDFVLEGMWPLNGFPAERRCHCHGYHSILSMPWARPLPWAKNCSSLILNSHRLEKGIALCSYHTYKSKVSRGKSLPKFPQPGSTEVQWESKTSRHWRCCF